MSNLDIYNKVRVVPEEAQKPITGGRLNGMTDINPMWRIKTLTEQFGPCGLGWVYNITEKRIEEGANGEKVAFVDIELYVKSGEEWSRAIAGTGGSSFIAKERNGLYTSDECFKMALTDALSVACKALGIGADIYFAKDRSKYDELSEGPVDKTNDKPIKTLSDPQVKRLYAIAHAADITADTVNSQIKTKFNKQVNELTKEQYDMVCKSYETLKKARA